MSILNKIITANILCASLLVCSRAQAQTDDQTIVLERSVLSSGGYAAKLLTDDLQLDCTIGEAMVHTITYQNFALTQGFQQPPSGRDGRAAEQDPMVIYPNPANSDVTVTYILDTLVQIDVKVVNYIGQTVYTETVMPISLDFTYTLPSAKFHPGLYLVSLFLQTGVTVTRKLFKGE